MYKNIYIILYELQTYKKYNIKKNRNVLYFLFKK